MDVIEHTQDQGYQVEVVRDDDPMSPREWDNVGRFAGLNGWMFNDHPADSAGEAYREARSSEDGGILALPVEVLDGPYTIVRETSWDHADGIYWAALAETEAMGDHGFRTVDALRACLRAELDTLNSYLAGDVYGFVVTDPTGETVDSCYGFVGEADYALTEGLESARYAAFMAACAWAELPEWVRQYVLAHAS